MRQQCEFETSRMPVRALTHERQRRGTKAKMKPSGARGGPRGGPGGGPGGDAQIDLERIVWDPEYRSEILESMRARV